MTGSIIRKARLRAQLGQAELAARAGTSQSAIARLEGGQSSPTLATLTRLAAAAGFELRVDLIPLAPPDPVVQAYKRDVDRTLLRENLRRSVDDRLRSMEELREFGRELERAVVRARKGKR